MRRQRSTKIVATLGPASSTEAMVEALFEAGIDVFRLNYGYGNHDEYRQRMDAVRSVERRYGRPIATMMDLKGPQLHLGTFIGGTVSLHAGQTFHLDLDATPGNEDRCYIPHPEVLAAVDTGSLLLLGDERLRVTVVDRHPDLLEVTVLDSGELRDGAQVRVPGAMLPISALTVKDREDVAFGLELGIDILSLSFVQRPEDVAEARRLVGGRAALMTKLQKSSALDRLDEIIALSDIVMVARGDLGVEMPPEEVPVLQRRIIRACRWVGKPVVVATQMLESMIKMPAPTRAEASDVAAAIYEGADAVMLLAETATGAYPIEAASMMDRIARRVHADPGYGASVQAGRTAPDQTDSDAITAAARQTAETVRTAAIVTFTTSGSTTLRTARERPAVPIIGVTREEAVARRLAIAWGVHSVVEPELDNTTDLAETALRISRDHGFAQGGDRVVITAGAPFGQQGTTNIMRIAHMPRALSTGIR